MIVKVLFIMLFIVLGVILSLGKGAFFIAGFNIMKKEEKEKYDVISLCKFMGKLMFMLAFCITLFALGDIFAIKALFNIGLALFLISIIFAAVYANTANRFKK